MYYAMFLQLLFLLCVMSPLPPLCIQQELTALRQAWESERSPGRCIPHRLDPTVTLQLPLACSGFELSIYPPGFFLHLVLHIWLVPCFKILQSMTYHFTSYATANLCYLWPSANKLVMCSLCPGFGIRPLMDTVLQPSASSLDLAPPIGWWLHLLVKFFSSFRFQLKHYSPLWSFLWPSQCH